MRLRYGLLFIALLLCGHTLTIAQTPAQATQPPAAFRAPVKLESADVVVPRAAAPFRPLPAPLVLKGKHTLYRTAYLDTYHILSEHNACSSFFGGAFALEAFNDLAAQMIVRSIGNTRIGMLMEGETTNVIINSTGQAYRLFAHATLNREGAFFRGNVSVGAHVPRVGRFAPNTRAARVLILLHELAHLIRQPDGQWLIPNDGLNEEQSERNTALVEGVCGMELNALAD